MGDPLSITASIAGLVSLGLQTTEYLYTYYTTYRGQNDDLTQIANKLGDLIGTVQILDGIVHTRKWPPSEKIIVQHIEKSIARYEDAIQDLRDEAHKLKNVPCNSLKSHLVAAGRRAAYPFRRSTLEKLSEDVDDVRNNLSQALQALELTDHQHIRDDIEELSTIVKKGQAQNVNVGVRGWLKAPDATINFNIANSKRHPGTGLWLVQGAAFNSWLRRDNSFLWLYGFPGCGKSVLCSTAIQHVQRHQMRMPNSASAFFFFTFNDESKQDASAALRALLLQLCGQIVGCEADLDRLKDMSNQGIPLVKVLVQYLRQTITRCRHVYILLDALDESPKEPSRTEVLKTIMTIRNWNLPGVHLLVTSRDLPDIRDLLKTKDLSQDTEKIWLNNDNTHEDIADYVSHIIENDPRLRRWSKIQREKISNYLIEHADGVFRWVECQLKPLRECPRSDQLLEKCLRSLPEDLDTTYERILSGISEVWRNEAQQMLALLCFAARPLSVDEVIEARAVDIDLECYRVDKRYADVDDILRICPGLIEVSSPSLEGDGVLIDKNPASLEEDSDEVEQRWHNRANESERCQDIATDKRIIRIAHFSVQEYLVSDQIRSSHAAIFALSGPEQHFRLCKACLLYFVNDDYLRQPRSSRLAQQYAWIRYAAARWVDHYRQADPELVRGLSQRVIQLLSTSETLYRWVEFYCLRDESELPLAPAYDVDIDIHPSPVYYAALLGLDDLLRIMLSNSAADIEVQGGRFGTALIAASWKGYRSAVQELLDQGADINMPASEEDDHFTALISASRMGREKIVELLLDRDADINMQAEGDNRTALIAASKKGEERIVNLLLDRGADIDMQVGGHHCTALIGATRMGQLKIVSLLLNRGAEIDLLGGDKGTTALITACEWGEEEIVKVLLDHGANIDLETNNGITALIMAASRGREEIVQLLLDRGANINHQTRRHTALLAAVSNGMNKVVQLLLAHGADITLRGRRGTALEEARRRSSMELEVLLLAYDRGSRRESEAMNDTRSGVEQQKDEQRSLERVEHMAVYVTT